MKNANYAQQNRVHSAFTVIELLAVLGVLFLLSLILLPALAGTRTTTKTAHCMNNLRRLTGAWLMYTSDNADLLPLKLAGNIVDWTGSNPDNTNTAKLLDSLQSPLARYIQSADSFKCPADTFQSPANSGPRVLSVSGNAVLGNGIQPANVMNQISGRTYIAKFTKFTQLNQPGPANTSVILDEHPDSIDDSLFIFSVGRSQGFAFWVNLPGSYHDGAGTISFADGHVILKRWLDTRTAPPVTYTTGIQRNINVPGSPDYSWLNDRMPYQ